MKKQHKYKVKSPKEPIMCRDVGKVMQGSLSIPINTP